MSEPSLLSDYPIVVTLPVFWGDQDAFGHVNNTVHLRWFESSRVAYLEQSELFHVMTPGGVGPILVAIACNYRRQIRYPDTVRVGARVAEVGRTSLLMEHQVLSESQQAVAADGTSTLVMFDFANQRPVRISDELRSAIERREGRELPSRPARSDSRRAGP